MNSTLKNVLNNANIFTRKKIKQIEKTAVDNPKIVIGIGIGAGLLLAPYVTLGALLGATVANKIRSKKLNDN